MSLPTYTVFTTTVGSPAIPLPGTYQEKTKIVVQKDT